MISLAGNRLRSLFASLFHALDDTLDNLSDAFQCCFRLFVQPTQAWKFSA